MAIQLREVIAKILASGMTQDALAAEVNTTQGKISDMLQGRRTWEKHWRVFIKLLPICLKLDLIGEQELLPRKHHDTQPNPSSHKASKIPASQRK